MKIQIHHKTLNGEIIFSWKELWTLIKRRKLIIDANSFENFVDTLSITLVRMKIMKHDRDKENKEKEQNANQ